MPQSVSVRAALSPSRAGDFQTCPLLYRFRVVDRLPEPADPVAARGTLVHSVLEVLFDEQPDDRTLERALSLLDGQWAALRQPDERFQSLFGDQAAEADWLRSAHPLLANYFQIEDPRTLEPAHREQRVEYVDGEVVFGGIADRIDIAPDGRLRIVDLKTGKAPSERFEDKSLFQMKFYALVVWRSQGVIPSLLQLYYLSNGEVLSYVPDEPDLLATERKLRALWQAITKAYATADFPAKPGPLCRFCAHQALCPEFGGTPPDVPTIRIEPVAPSAT
jgi:putative RecB family exonuclease